MLWLMRAVSCERRHTVPIQRFLDLEAFAAGSGADLEGDVGWTGVGSSVSSRSSTTFSTDSTTVIDGPKLNLIRVPALLSTNITTWSTPIQNRYVVGRLR